MQQSVNFTCAERFHAVRDRFIHYDIDAGEYLANRLGNAGKRAEHADP